MKVKNLLGITGLSTLVLLFFVAAFTSCSSDDEFAETIAPQQKMIAFKATVGDKGADAVAAAKAANGKLRVLSLDGSRIKAQWAVGEQIAVVFNGAKYVATVTEVAGNGSAVISGEVPAETPDNQAVDLIYPASAVTDAGAIKDDLLASQLGTLSDVSDNFDVTTATGNLSVSGTTATLKDLVTFTTQNAICNFQFQDKGNSNAAITGITELVISDNSDNVITTATLSDAANTVFVAMAPIATKSKVKFALTADGKNYEGTANAKLVAGKYYPITLKVTEVAASDAVDLGLSVKWAPYNVGATSETEYGDYFAWGEVTPKTTYSWSTYAWGTAYNALTKYNNKSSYGTVDNKTSLDPEDDAAHVNMGGTWRMPTAAEFQELIDNTTHAWVTNYKGSGVNGFTFTGNGNTIFLPAAGYRSGTGLSYQGTYGNYWSSSLYESSPGYGRDLYFDSGGDVDVYDCNRFFGLSVRAVKP